MAAAGGAGVVNKACGVVERDEGDGGEDEESGERGGSIDLLWRKNPRLDEPHRIWQLSESVERPRRAWELRKMVAGCVRGDTG